MLRPGLLAVSILAVTCLYPVHVPAQHHAQATSPVLDRDQALAHSQSVIGHSPADYILIDQDRQEKTLHGYRGKPLVVNFIFTSCYHTCPVMTAHLKEVVETARDALGEESFNMLSIGFDTAVDTPEAMRLFASQRGIDFNGWDFVSADAGTIDQVTRELGFSFAPSPSGFDHLAQTTVLNSEGMIYRQVYGATFETVHLVEPLKELVFGNNAGTSTVQQWINGIKLFCTVYDPTSNRYVFDYSIFYSIAIGLLCLGSVLVFVVRSWREHDVKSSE